MTTWTRQELVDAIASTKKAINESTSLRETSQHGRDGGTQSKGFRSLKELREHLAYLERELAALDGTSGIRMVPMIPSRGETPW